jgi:hypothetical protein
MAITQLNQLQIAFKKLLGKAHVSPRLAVGEEAIGSFVQLGSNTIFADPIPTTGLPSNLYETSDGNIVEKVRFELVALSDGLYNPENGTTLSSTSINKQSEQAGSGNHTYALKLSGSYNTRSNNPKKGTAPFTDGYFLTGSAGSLQLVPPAFNVGYTVTLYNSAGTIIPPLANINWILDYSTGVLYAQDAPFNATFTPALLDAYIYIGKYLSDDKTQGYSGSFSGSFQGDGAGLTNLPAASIVGLNLSQTATGSVSASVSIGDTSFQVVSSSSTLVSSTSTGRLVVSKSVNIGTPTTNAWNTNLEGSYFNNFTDTDDVADILRFMAGILSASAPDAAPNTRTWLSTNIAFNVGTPINKSSYMSGILSGSTYRSAKLSKQWNQSNLVDLSKTGSYRALQSYLISKGWMNSSETGSDELHDVGTNPFGTDTYGSNVPSSIYNNNFSAFTFDADSVVDGTTVFSSSLGAKSFGLGTVQTPTIPKPFSVQLVYTQSFSDTASVTIPNASSTFSTSASRQYTRSTVGTSDGLYLGILNTANPVLIPNTYQDGYFENVQANTGGRIWGVGGTSGTVTSSIGYYRLHDISVGLSSSVTPGYVTKTLNTNNINGFYMPSLSTLNVQNIVSSDSTSIIGNASITAFSATSRSLSGAPYLSTVTYTVEYNSQVSKSFDPCYAFSTAPIAISKTDGWATVGSTSLPNISLTVNSSGIQTSSSIAGVFAAGNGADNIKSIGEIPAIGDTVFISASYTFNSLTANSYIASNNYNLSFTTTGRNWKNETNSATTSNISFYDATRFGQPSTSGSMAIYTRAQGYDNRLLTTRTESFFGEDYRLRINNNLLSGSWANGTKFTTDTEEYYNLTNLDLQIKPGSLVRPGVGKGYWLPDDGTEFKYYAVAFNSNSSNQINSFILNVTSGSATSFVKWNDTASEGIAALIFFSNPDALNFAVDPKENALSAQVFTSGTNGTNPFTVDITVTQGGSFPTVPVTSPRYFLNEANQNFVVLLRMKGDKGPITSISYSA